MIIATFKLPHQTGTAGPIDIEIHQVTATRFSVVIIDVDAGEVSRIRFYTDLEKAMAYARKVKR